MQEIREITNERQNAYGTSKDQILKAALKLFAEHGYRNTTLKDVAKESSANTALVGYHFGSKDGLRQAVIDQQLQAIHIQLDSVLSLGNQITWNDFDRIIEILLNKIDQGDAFFRLLQWSIFECGDQTEKFLQGFFEPLFEKLTGVVRKLNSSLTESDLEVRMLAAFNNVNQYAYYRCFIERHINLTISQQEIAQRLKEIHKAQIRSLVLP